MSDEYDDYCDAWPVSCPENPQDEGESRTCVVFSISIYVSFINLPPGSSEDDEDELPIDELVETERGNRVFEVERDRLVDEEDEEKARSTVQNMLSSMDVPERPFMVDKILACARSMASNKAYANHKVLAMNVSISVVGEESETEDLGPASEASIQELGIVEFEEGTGREQCGICLEEFSSSLAARRMPCSHIFHGHCIIGWLHIRKFCPLCRFKLN